MKWILSTLFFVLLSLPCRAQQDSLPRTHEWLLKWNPFSLIGYPSVQLGAEYFYKPLRSLHAEAGLILPLFEQAAISPEDNHGYRLQFQHRHYYKNCFFIGPEIQFTDVHYKSTESFATLFYMDSAGVRTPIDDSLHGIGVRKKIVCLNITGGVQSLKFKRFGAEFFGGLGVRYVQTVFSNAPEGEEHLPSYSDVAPTYFQNKTEGERYMINLVLGMRLFFRFKS